MATCTDIKQKWGTSKQEVHEQFAAKKVSSMCCIKAIPKHTTSSEIDDLNFADLLAGITLKSYLYGNM